MVGLWSYLDEGVEGLTGSNESDPFITLKREYESCPSTLEVVHTMGYDM